MNKRIVTILLGLVMSFSLLACTNNEKVVQNDAETKEEKQRSNVIETDAETGETYYLLADFENYFECTQVKYSASFGKITEISKEEQPDMVTNGEQSVRLDILGTETSWFVRRPAVRFSTTNGFFNITYDFSNMSKFTFDIYNAQEHEVTIRFYKDGAVNTVSTMENRATTHDNYEYSIVTKVDLAPKQWNHVEINAADIKGIAYDVNEKPYQVYGAEALKTVGGFNLLFERSEATEEEQVFYLDNVRAYMNSEDKATE